MGKEVAFPDPQWGAALWALLMAGNLDLGRHGLLESASVRRPVRHLHQPLRAHLGLFALLFGSSYEAQTIPWLLAGFIYLYLNYPGVQQPFIDNEMSKLSPEQREAMGNLAKANAEAGAPSAPGMGTPAAESKDSGDAKT